MNLPISDILARTPAWVFVMFAYLIWRSLSRLQPRVVSAPKVWIMPGLFIAWGLWGLLDRSGDLSAIASRWVAGAVLGCALGLLSRIPLKLDRERQLVWLPGSILPLLRVIVIFGAHYILNVAAVMHPDNHDMLMNWDIVVSGASAGYFIGWGIRFVRACNRAEHTPLATRTRKSVARQSASTESDR